MLCKCNHCRTWASLASVFLSKRTTRGTSWLIYGNLVFFSVSIIFSLPGKDEDMQGKVIKIAYSPTIESNVTNYEAIVEFTTKTDKLLKSGMTTDVDIITFEKKDVLLLPKKAVSKRKGSEMVLILNEKDETYPQEVEIGDSDDDNVEIISGLEEGDKVIIMERGTDKNGTRTEERDTRGTSSGDPSRMMRRMIRGR